MRRTRSFPGGGVGVGHSRGSLPGRVATRFGPAAFGDEGASATGPPLVRGAVLALRAGDSSKLVQAACVPGGLANDAPCREPRDAAKRGPRVPKYYRAWVGDLSVQDVGSGH